VVDSPKTLLIIDDDQQITTILKRLLDTRGYSVTTYNDPIKAVADFQPGRYKLVICDMRMPGLGGLEVCREIRSKDRSIRICMFSAFDFVDLDADGELAKLHVDAYLQKPVSIDELTKTIESILARTAAGRHGMSVS
jgi:DNA-binding response OmpR family regulator